MTTDIKPRIRVPKSVKKGDVFEVKTLVTHLMESGQRPNKETGSKYPRDIINSFIVTYNAKEVLKATWHAAVSANPYTAFYVVAEESGPMVFTWIDDNGTSYSKEVPIIVAE
ncbi:MAG: thiosulfate oxidation carrier complex protein SoxZ [Rhodospirillaceae bacterium]|nr:thiosulfate oxidation carrier complex protein SoxZ [Rhodospirillaceae bacterium]